MSRFEIAEDGWDERQRAFAEHLRGSARGKIGQPFLNLLPVPELAKRVADLGEWLRFKGALEADVRELVTLAASEFWRCPYEWLAHAPLARKAGLSVPVLASLARGESGDALTSSQRVALEAARAVLRSGKLDDAQFQRVSEVFGREGALEIVCLCGYYGLLAMVLHAGYADAEQPDWQDTLDATLEAAG
ncbi:MULTISPECIES: carboxymuconolactone decarboxylase family protein [unclassified Chelatococcus]|uniref:carboxymuconolactone decarboxylase family protein n=1 Tax=unclassified Chelatococcus TaxID=2638111 RepID=UPI001BCAF5A7|nr:MULTISPECIES: carboxymuconolactone decarboxylase family protein [unclassified Chelatococcus]MBS7697219.1 carboxymuconolactone decarboxylase family protein [Chelatococcus sp. YT9]MBX3556484.1 carboxymuconolactone decarboxylase family protein [Chelatococcus sp.]